MTVLDGPLTGAVVSEFLEFCFCGEAPGAAPLFAGYIVGGVAGDVAHLLAVGGAVFFGVTALGGGFAPSVVIAVVSGGTGAYITGCPFYAEA